MSDLESLTHTLQQGPNVAAIEPIESTSCFGTKGTRPETSTNVKHHRTVLNDLSQLTHLPRSQRFRFLQDLKDHQRSVTTIANILSIYNRIRLRADET